MDFKTSALALGALSFASLTTSVADARFIAVGNWGTIRYSDDMNVWYAGQGPTDDSLTGVATNGEIVVAVGKTGGVYLSPEGNDWTESVASLGEEFSAWEGVNIKGVRYVNGTFFAFGAVEEVGAVVNSSGVSLTSACLWRSVDDGQTWELVLKIPPVNVFDGLGSINDVTAGGGYFFAVGDTAEKGAYRSADGVTWEEQDVGSSWQAPTAVAYGNGRVVIGRERMEVLFSDDLGESWEYTESAGWYTYRHDVMFDGDEFFMLGDNGRYWRSFDGDEWEESQIPWGLFEDYNSRVRAIDLGGVYDQLTYIVVGFDGTVGTSKDGYDWTPRDPLTWHHLLAVTYLYYPDWTVPEPHAVTIESPVGGQLIDPTSTLYLEADVHYQVGGFGEFGWAWYNLTTPKTEYDVCDSQEDCVKSPSDLPGPGKYRFVASIGDVKDIVDAWYITQPPELTIKKPTKAIVHGGDTEQFRADVYLTEFGSITYGANAAHVHWQVAPVGSQESTEDLSVDLGTTPSYSFQDVNLPLLVGEHTLYATVWTDQWGPITAEQNVYFLHHCIKTNDCGVEKREAPRAGLLRAPLVATTSGKPFLDCEFRECTTDDLPPGFRGSHRWNPCDGRGFEWRGEFDADPRETRVTVDRRSATERGETLTGRAEGPIDIGVNTRKRVRGPLWLSATCDETDTRATSRDTETDTRATSPQAKKTTPGSR